MGAAFHFTTKPRAPPLLQHNMYAARATLLITLSILVIIASAWTHSVSRPVRESVQLSQASTSNWQHGSLNLNSAVRDARNPALDFSLKAQSTWNTSSRPAVLMAFTFMMGVAMMQLTSFQLCLPGQTDKATVGATVDKPTDSATPSSRKKPVVSLSSRLRFQGKEPVGKQLDSLGNDPDDIARYWLDGLDEKDTTTEEYDENFDWESVERAAPTECPRSGVDVGATPRKLALPPSQGTFKTDRVWILSSDPVLWPTSEVGILHALTEAASNKM